MQHKENSVVCYLKEIKKNHVFLQQTVALKMSLTRYIIAIFWLLLFWLLSIQFFCDNYEISMGIINSYYSYLITGLVIAIIFVATTHRL